MKKADAYASAFFITKYYIFYRGRICNSVGIHVESIVSTSHLIRMFKLNIKQLNALAQLADELLLDTNREEELVELLNVHLQTSFTFENDTCKGYFYYILGNCSSGLYKYRDQDWYSKNLIDTVNLYQKSVHFLRNETKNIGVC